MARCDSAMTTTPLMPNGLNSWKTTSTMVACARLAASTMDAFTMSRQLMASGSQSNSSSSRCRPSACTLSLLSGVFSAEKIFGQNFAHCGAIFLALQEKSGLRQPPGGSGATRQGTPEGAAGNFLLAFPGRADTMSKILDGLQAASAAAGRPSCEARRGPREPAARGARGCTTRVAADKERRGRRTSARHTYEEARGGPHGLDTSDQGGGHSRERRGQHEAQRLRQRLAGGGHRQYQPRQDLQHPSPGRGSRSP